MINPITYNELRALHAAGKPRDSFGPNSDTPYLALDLSHSKSDMNNWLGNLPCPVIGLGKGEASTACDVVLEDTKKLELISRNILAAPLTAMTLAQHLRAIENMPAVQALTVESFAYAALQQGPEFKSWLASYDGETLLPEAGPPVLTEISNNTLSITLNRPKNYNAIGTEVRDALCEILDMAIIHDQFTSINISGKGRTFSIGGAIQEFGQTTDPSTAHWIRSICLPATRVLQLREKLNVQINGAAIGAGIEIAAFAKHVSCSPRAWFQLPELKYGLIPGAGGTVSIMNRIGRQKTAYMALTMEKISAKTAAEWGLVDEVGM